MRTVVGKVVSNKMQKSILVGVTRYFMHKKYPKRVNKQRKFMAHDEENACNIGDIVRIDSSRPISKLKAWRLTEILRREPQHRLEASGAIDLQVIAVWLEKSFPCLALLFIIFLREHWLGLTVFGCLTFNLRAANHVLREQVKLKERRDNTRLWTIAMCYGIQVPAMITTVRAISSQELWPRFILWMPASVPTVWHATVLAIATDALARVMGCAFKAAVLAVHRATPDDAFRRRSSLLTFMEHLLLCYRMMLTTPIWVRYFLYMPGHLTPVSLAGMYVAFKVHMVYRQIGMIFAAAKVASRSEALFGKYASSDEVMEVGNSCAICQESMEQPVKLSCNHIFCNSCILEWFERECTCPMCRAVIKPKGLTSHSDGSTALLPQIF
ncbi:hypothetical protein WJX84_002024 [Apatococcus fuscideae]|uniref:Small ribosomal subunit protein uS17c n=1 Tax=Apatococcus fuscideae TaxID=2026836 RepID=A0AAW1T5J9_9CHLO